jgi:NTP pyrophosphatase (non-canonical NTP hydrolase)
VNLMCLKDIQRDVDEWTSQYTPQYWPPYEMLARLTEEIGELAREINNLYGVKKKKPDEPTKNLGQEITDVLFTLVCMANSHGINMQEEWVEMMEKKNYGRDKDRFERKHK